MALHSLLKQFSSYYQNDTSLTLISFILALFFFYLIGAIRKNYHHSKLKLPPSPPKLPIIGNLHQLGSLPHRSFQSLSQKYGPIFFLQLGQYPTIVISSPELASEVMKTHDLTFADRPQLTGPKFLLYGSTDVGFSCYNENWTEKRKICENELLRQKKVQSFSHIREEEVGEMVKKLREVSLSGEKSVNLSEVMAITLNDIMCKCLFGDKISREESARFGKLAQKVLVELSAFSVGDYFPCLEWVDVLTGLIPRMKALSKELDEYFDEVIQDHKNRPLYKDASDHHQFSNTTNNLLDGILQLQQDGRLHHDFTQYDIKSVLQDMLVAAKDANPTVMSWAMAELVRNPTKMKKAQEEIRRIVGSKSKVDENDIEKMSYLKCVVKETLRLYPPTPVNAPRIARSSVELNGYNIPAKTTVYVNSWAIHRDPKYWESPEEFLPERFEKNDVAMNGQDFQLLPFGSGRRGCPGLMFAVASLECLLANLLYWFDWELPNDVASIKDIDMTEFAGFATIKKVPLYLQPIPHSFGS